MFGSVITIAFQGAFYAEIHQNDVFFYFLKLAYQNNSKHTKTKF